MNDEEDSDRQLEDRFSHGFGMLKTVNDFQWTSSVREFGLAPHNAALMSEALAGLLVAKLNNTGHHAETCELLCDENSAIHDSLVDIGEA